MVIHKHKEWIKKKGRKRIKCITVCGSLATNPPNIVSHKWSKVTCRNCLRLRKSDGVNFYHYRVECDYHTYSKLVVGDDIKYVRCCTYYEEIMCCHRDICPMLNKHKKLQTN